MKLETGTIRTGSYLGRPHKKINYDAYEKGSIASGLFSDLRQLMGPLIEEHTKRMSKTALYRSSGYNYL